MGLLSWIIVGLLAGAVAGVVTGRRAGGCLPTVLVGVLGAIVGGVLFNAVGERGVTELDLWSVFVATIGASLLLLVLGRVRP